MLSLDNDHGDSDDSCKSHEPFASTVLLMLQCVISDGKSRCVSVIKDGKATACYSILSKTDSEILLQSDTNEVEKGAASL